MSAKPSTQNLARFTRELIQDLRDLRANKITNADARVRAQLAREVLRAAHLELEGMRLLSDNAKLIGGGRS